MRLLGAAILSSLVLAGCSLAPAPEEDPVQIKLTELEGRLSRIERSNTSVVGMAQTLEASQAEVRRLRGRLEELENSTEALKAQQRNLYADLDKRLSGMTVAPTMGGGMSTGGGAPGGASEQALYTVAFDALKTSNYPSAIGGFQTFLSSYPNSDMADNAQYWLGEAYYVTRDYERASAAFRTVGERWPNSRKAADALVKLGFTQHELKRIPEARATLTEVMQRFPDTEAARLAAERLKRLPR
jgi:tol-pal system protein YbgF